MDAKSTALTAPEAASLATKLQTLEKDAKRAQYYADRARAKNTNRAYEADWRRFEEWCVDRGQTADTARPAAVATFLVWFAEQRKDPRNTAPDAPTIALPSVVRAYAGIAKRFRRLKTPGWEGRGRPSEVAEVIAGLQHEITHIPAPKSAVTERELRAMMGKIAPGLAGIRDRALILVGFFGAFRRSALVSLNVSDITFLPEGIKVRIRRDKTDQTGKGRTFGVFYMSALALCPVRALKAWLEAANITEGAIFRPFSRRGDTVLKRRLTSEMVSYTVKKLATAAGLDPARFAGHSLRSGFVTTAHRKKKSMPAIMKITGHKKMDTTLGYVRDEDVFEDNATEGLF